MRSFVSPVIAFVLALGLVSVGRAADDPYTEKEVAIAAPGARLAATLTMPKSGKPPYPAVVLVAESGPVDRDESWGLGNGTLREIARALAACGIASVRYDPRGVPQSEGNLLTAGLYDMAVDASYAALSLKMEAGIDRQRVAILGHGNGAKAALIAAQRVHELAGVVLLAPVLQKEPDHVEAIMRFYMKVEGHTSEDATRVLAEHRHFIEGIHLGRYVNYEDYFLDPTLPNWLIQAQKTNPQSPSWWRDVTAYDPIEGAKQAPCPLLMLWGENDWLIDPDLQKASAQAIIEARPKDVTIKTFKDLNHRFVWIRNRRDAYLFEKNLILSKPDTSYPMEKGVLEAISKWLKGAFAAVKEGH